VQIKKKAHDISSFQLSRKEIFFNNDGSSSDEIEGRENQKVRVQKECMSQEKRTIQVIVEAKQ